MEIKEKSNGIIDLSPFKNNGLYFVYAYIVFDDGSSHTIQDYGNPGDEINLVEYANGKPYIIEDIRLWGKNGFYLNGQDIQMGVKRKSHNQLWEKYKRLYAYHFNKESEHSKRSKKAKLELRPLAENEHQRAFEFHRNASLEYTHAKNNKDNSKGTQDNLFNLTEQAKAQTQKAFDSDNNYQKEFPNREWFNERGFKKLLATSWESSNRNVPSLVRVGNAFNIVIPSCKRIKKLQYRTKRSNGWQPYETLTQWAYMIGNSWTGELEFRANKDDKTIVKFIIPKFPQEFNEQKELEEAIKLLKGNHVKKGIDTLEGIQEKRREKKANEEEIRMAIEKNHLFIGQENHWKALKLALGPTKDWGTMNPRGSKNRYKIVPKHILETLIKMSGVSSRKYVHDLFVCKEFCIALMDYLAGWGINCFTWVRSDGKENGSQHEWLILHYINDDGIVEAWHLEPQRGKWIEKAKWFQGDFIIKDSYMVS